MWRLLPRLKPGATHIAAAKAACICVDLLREYVTDGGFVLVVVDFCPCTIFNATGIILYSRPNSGNHLLKWNGETEIWRYFQGIGREKNIRIYTVGGIEDHIHILCSIPASKAVSDAVQELKGNSSRWMKQRYGLQEMGWQSGYGSFTTSESAMSTAMNYIQNQRAHHLQEDFDEELKRIIRLHELGELRYT